MKFGSHGLFWPQMPKVTACAVSAVAERDQVLFSAMYWIRLAISGTVTYCGPMTSRPMSMRLGLPAALSADRWWSRPS